MLDNVVPKGKWEFNQEVAECFENMLERSIPDYHRMRDLTRLLVTKDMKINCNQNYSLLDIGCSNGINMELFANEPINLYGIDISEPMIDKAKSKFADRPNTCICCFDVRDGLKNIPNFTKMNYITSILTLQFVPMEYRQEILTDIYNSLLPNGMFIFVEKVMGSNSVINNLLVDSYYSIKNANGYSYESIDRKKKSLEGVLVPCTSAWNVDLLKQAGFKQIETFWRCLNFEGIVAIKEGY